ncbi:MAG: hypothetical protein IJP20_00980 [Clostridia bacterium]|nr:hypothetical protein [Clostridia bacterium]
MDKNTVLRHILENTAQGMRNAARGAEQSAEPEMEKSEHCYDERRGRGSILTPLAVGVILLLMKK